VVSPHDLPDADGIMFGIPTRYGMAAAQVKALLDATGSLWTAGKLIGKPAGIFFSTATQGGGQETTALTFLTQLTHHGMLWVPMGYSTPLLFNMDEVHGGSPYGAGTYAGPDGSRQPTALELDVAKHHGKHFGSIAAALKRGRDAIAAEQA
jgi:NAD(P)H dehydrogenase (quinone)